MELFVGYNKYILNILLFSKELTAPKIAPNY